MESLPINLRIDKIKRGKSFFLFMVVCTTTMLCMKSSQQHDHYAAAAVDDDVVVVLIYNLIIIICVFASICGCSAVVQLCMRTCAACCKVFFLHPHTCQLTCNDYKYKLIQSKPESLAKVP